MFVNLDSFLFYLQSETLTVSCHFRDQCPILHERTLTMNDLTGKCVNVVLAVEIGRGLSFLEHSVKVVANFNGRPLESDPVNPEANPVFNTELVWETEKKEVRRARSTNAPLRVEIQVADKNHRKDRVGFVLLSPRTATIIPSNSRIEIPFKWHKLLGVSPEFKSNHPELYLSFTIRDMLVNPVIEETLSGAGEEDDEKEEDDDEDIEEIEREDHAIPIQYLPDGFIQIGQSKCRETFLMSIIIKTTSNLDMLLPEVLVFNPPKEKYYLAFKIVGITIKSKPLMGSLHSSIPLNEKIVVRIRSGFDILKTYLSEHCRIIVSFHCGHDKLGLTELMVNTLLSDMQEEEFIIHKSTVNYEQICYLKFPSSHGIVPTSLDGRRPEMSVGMTLQRTQILPKSHTTSEDSIEEENAEDSQFQLEDLNREINHGKEAETDEVESEKQYGRVNVSGCGDLLGDAEELGADTKPVSAYGDQKQKEPVINMPVIGLTLTPRRRSTPNSARKKSASGSTHHTPRQSSSPNVESPKESPRKKARSTEELKSSSVNVEIKSSSPNVEAKPSSHGMEVNLYSSIPAPSLKIQVEDITKSVNKYQQYCLDIILEKVTFNKPLRHKKLCFKFMHPKASSSTIITSEVSNEDDWYGEEIVLENTRCKMFFVSTDDHVRNLVYSWAPKLVITTDNDQPLSEELDIYTVMFLSKQRMEGSYITECKAVRTYEVLAKLHIIMYLQEYGLPAMPQCTDYDLLPQIIDEEVTIEQLEDLQEWKQKQQAQFFADLKIYEKQRMNQLEGEWSTKKRELEKKLTKSIVRCRHLSQELQTASNYIRTKKALDQKEDEMNATCTFDDTVQKNVDRFSNTEKQELIETISKLEREKEHLNGIITDLRQEIQQIRKTALTKEQTTTLLQQLRGLEEKFEEAQKAKGYFKDQYKKAVQEIHVLRSEEQKMIQEKLQNHKMELSQFSLDSFAHSDVGSGKYEEYSSGGYSNSGDNFKWNTNYNCSLGIPSNMPFTTGSKNL